MLYCCVLCCITDLHILFIRVAHNGPGPTDGLCFQTAYFPRMSAPPGPLQPPDSPTLILSCYYLVPSTAWLRFLLYATIFRDQTLISPSVSVCSLSVPFTGEREVWRPVYVHSVRDGHNAVRTKPPREKLQAEERAKQLS